MSCWITLCQRDKRERYRELGRAEGATVRLYWFTAPPSVLHERVAARAGRPGPNAFEVSAVQLDAYLDHAQPPGPDEHATVIETA
ncbi:MAG: AAA family ATPase [Micropruina sp.]|nr:MAG: AAA family ATPase [Micropruina sp.]